MIRPSTRRVLLLALLPVINPVLSPSRSQAANPYSVLQAGLYDSSTTNVSHTAATGQVVNQFALQNFAGDLAGSATRYEPTGDGNSTAGTNFWYFDPTSGPKGTTTEIGFFDDDHTNDSNGVQQGSIVAMNALGQVIGTSVVFDGYSAQAGNTAWLYTPGGTSVAIGLLTSIYQDPNYDNYGFSYVTGMDNAGDVTGTSRIISGTASGQNQDAYFYNALTGMSTAIGLGESGAASANYNSGASGRYSNVFGINQNGFVAGASANYAESGNPYDAFIYNPHTGASTQIGLNSATFGTNVISALNNAAVAGYNNSGNVWIYEITGPNAGTTSISGLLSSLYVGSAGSHVSSWSSINAQGQGIGQSYLYGTASGSETREGTDAFLFNGQSTILIGLTDAQHTANPAAVGTDYRGNATYTIRTNTASYLNNVGQVIGTSARFNTVSHSTSQVGQNAWFYNPGTGTTSIIGLIDSTTVSGAVSHTASDGVTQNSSVYGLNDSGQAIGTSTRYVGANSKGTDAWLYSSATGQTGTIGLTDALHTASDLTVQNVPRYLTSGGLVAGTAARFATTSTTSLGTDAWLYDSHSNTNYQITPSVGSTGFAMASLNFLSESGLVLGTFIKSPDSSGNGATDVYAYQEGQSVIDLGTMSTDLTLSGWQSLGNHVLYMDGNGNVAGSGLLNGDPDAYGYNSNGNMDNEAALNLVNNNPTTVSTAYWSGVQGSRWIDATATKSVVAGNFFTSANGGTFVIAYPVSTTDVYFSNVGTFNLTNTLGKNFDIHSLNIVGGAGAVTIGGNNTLQLEAGGISVGNIGGATISTSSLVLGTTQTWTNTSASPLTVTSAISGTSALTTLGSVILSGVSTFSGGTTIAGGTLDITGAIIGTPTITINANLNRATLVLDGVDATSPTASIVGTGTGSFAPGLIVNSGQTFASLTSSGTTIFTNGTSTIGTIDGPGTFTVGTTGSVVGVSAQYVRQAALSIGSVSTVTINDSPAPGNATATSVVTDIFSTGTLDLKNNDLIVSDSSQYAGVKAAIIKAADFVNGTAQYDQPGITSSSAAAKAASAHNYGLGYSTPTLIAADNQTSIIPATFDNQAVGPNAVLVKYTLLGDTTLKGSVNGGDYNTLVAHYNSPGDWAQGNFNGTSTINGADYNELVANYNTSATGQVIVHSAAIARALGPGISPGVSLSPAVTPAPSGAFKVVVNSTTGDVQIQNTQSTAEALTLYNIVDPGGKSLSLGNSVDSASSTTPPTPGPYTNEHYLSVPSGDPDAVPAITGRSANNYKLWSVVQDGATGAGGEGLSEGQATGKSADTINVPAGTVTGDVIDLGDIYIPGSPQDLTFEYSTQSTSGASAGPDYLNQTVSYPAAAPEPGSLMLLSIGAMGVLGKRRRANLGSNKKSEERA